MYGDEVRPGEIPTLDLENWMSNLPAQISSLPIIYVSIPGSHNSFSYSLTTDNGISPDAPPLVQLLGKWFRPITTRIVYNWSQGQNADITTQLCKGVRYFDIRLVAKQSEIYVAHGLYGGEIKKYLEEIRSFLEHHRQEIVILDFQHFYCFDIEHHVNATNMIEDIFGHVTMPCPSYINDVTLDKFWQQQKQVVIVYRNDQVQHKTSFWSSVMWSTPWPNKIKPEDLILYLDHELKDRNLFKGLVTQCLLTPDVRYVTLRPCGSLERNLAVPCNKKLTEWLKKQNGGPQGVNVAICDFIVTRDEEFIKTVIGLNYKCNSKNVQDTSLPVVDKS